ncbi:hypothetical protein CEN44_01195, partial [Fischerella muscicola CCMEE 5323]
KYKEIYILIKFCNHFFGLKSGKFFVYLFISFLEIARFIYKSILKRLQWLLTKSKVFLIFPGC